MRRLNVKVSLMDTAIMDIQSIGFCASSRSRWYQVIFGTLLLYKIFDKSDDHSNVLLNSSLDHAGKFSQKTISVSNHEGSNAYQTLKDSFFLEYQLNRS